MVAELPAQMVVGPVIIGVRLATDAMVTVMLPGQLLASATVSVYVPAARPVKFCVPLTSLKVAIVVGPSRSV